MRIIAVALLLLLPLASAMPGGGPTAAPVSAGDAANAVAVVDGAGVGVPGAWQAMPLPPAAEVAHGLRKDGVRAVLEGHEAFARASQSGHAGHGTTLPGLSPAARALLGLAPGGADPAAERAAGPGDAWHAIQPLGDADGDRRADILMSRFQGDDSVVYTALGAARQDRVLWTIADNGTDTLYPAGDFDGDGVLDLLLESGSQESRPDGMDIQVHTTILSGRDLSTLTSFTMHGSWSAGSDALPVLVGREETTFEAELPFAVPAPGPGYIVLRLHYKESTVREGVVVATTQSTSSEVGITVEAYSLENELAWEVGGPRQIPELLVVGPQGLGVVFSTGAADLEAGSAMLDPIMPRATETREVGLRYVDVSTGKDQWETSFQMTQTDRLFVVPVGDVAGEGLVLAVHVLGYHEDEALAGPQYVQHGSIRFLGAFDGILHREHRSEEAWDLVLPFADIDDDGIEEMLLLHAAGPPTSLAAIGLDFEARWESRLPEGTHVAPFDGDAVPDLFVPSGQRFDILDGRDLLPVWHGDLPARSAHDIDLDGGYDLASTVAQDGTVTLRIHNGAEGTLLWEKVLARAEDYEDVELTDADVWVAPAGDVDRDGAPDLILGLAGGGCEGCPDLRAVLAGSAADGKVFLRIDEAPLAPGVTAVVDQPATLGPAGRVMQSRLHNDAPAPSLMVAGAAVLGLVAAARRKRTT